MAAVKDNKYLTLTSDGGSFVAAGNRHVKFLVISVFGVSPRALGLVPDPTFMGIAGKARREAERSRYLGLHRPPADTTPSASVSGGGSSGVAPGERADATPDASSAAPPSALAAPTPARSYAPPPSLSYSTYRSSSTAGSAEAPWWWGTGGERAPSTERTRDSRPVPADAEQPQAIS